MIVGWKFGIKTLYCIVMMSIMFNLVDSFLEPDMMVRMLEGVDAWRLLLVVLGAASCGVGIAVSFMQGGSTGGTDIVAMIINKFRTVSYGRVLLMTDCGILIGSLFLTTTVTMVPTDTYLDSHKEAKVEVVAENTEVVATPEMEVVADATLVAENTTDVAEAENNATEENVVANDTNSSEISKETGKKKDLVKKITIDPLTADAFARMIYGFMMIAVIGYTVDLVQSGNQQSNQIMIFCKDYEAMAQMIMTKANRGATLIDAMGSYSKTPSKAVMVVCRKRDTSTILKLVREQDPNAFLTVGSVMGVYGQGFDALNKL
jgi:uncharacterized membrane-anchored protein YitT (DUF2179 family)